MVNNISDSINYEQNNFIRNNTNIFTGMGTFSGEHKIKMNNIPCSIIPLKRLSQALSLDVERELTKLIKGGIVSKVNKLKKLVQKSCSHKKTR